MKGKFLTCWRRARPIAGLMLPWLAAAILAGCVDSGGGAPKPDLQSAVQGGEGDLTIVEILPVPASAGNGAETLIAENDLLEVDVFQVDELDKTVRVEPDGRISLPLIGPVKAAGSTIANLEREIEQRYSTNYLQNPEVTVFMKESAGQRVTMEGEFARPGIYASSSNTTLLKATALAGGLTPLADERKLYVFREISGRRYVANYSIRDIREGKSGDPRIHGGDIIIAFQSGTKVAAQNLKEALGIAVSATRLATPF